MKKNINLLIINKNYLIKFKCRNLKKYEKVIQKAKECYTKFIALFSLNSEDKFSALFEKERIKYLAENEDEIKKERIISQKLLNSTSKSIKIHSLSKVNIVNELKNSSIKNEAAKIDKSCMDNVKNENDQISKNFQNSNESFFLENEKKEIDQKNSQNEENITNFETSLYNDSLNNKTKACFETEMETD